MKTMAHEKEKLAELPGEGKCLLHSDIFLCPGHKGCLVCLPRRGQDWMRLHALMKNPSPE